MHVTCRFFRDTLNAVTAALTWSFIEGDSREYLRNFRRLFMYSVSLEYMNNYAMEWEQRREKEKERKRWEVSTILLIRSIYRRGTIYLRHVAARLRFFSLVFPFVSLSHDPRTRRDRPYPRLTLRFLHRAILSATKRPCRVRHVFFFVYIFRRFLHLFTSNEFFSPYKM